MTLLNELREQGGNQHYIDRYLRFIGACKPNETDYTEKHHILPVSLFSAYKDDPENIVVLTGRQHYIAHYMLAKAFGGKMWFAFNQMKRLGHKGALYELSRKYMAEHLRIINTGRPKSLSDRSGISKRMKGMFAVIDKDGNRFLSSKSDPRYISGELKSYRVGYKNTEETKLKMSQNSGTIKKKAFHCKNETIFLADSDEIPDGYLPGLPPGSHSNVSKALSNTIWVTDIITGKVSRINKEMYNESMHIRGRRGFKGFEHINNSRSLKAE